MTKLMVTFRIFANAPNNAQILYTTATGRNRIYDPTQVQDCSTYYLKVESVQTLETRTA